MNIALLCKWWWKLFNTEVLWQEVLINKYCKNKKLAEIKLRQGDSQFWYEINKHKEHFLSLCKFEVGNGESVRFWEDRWSGDKPLKENFPRLYNLCFDKNKSLKHMINKGLDSVLFRRTLSGESLELWTHIKE